MPQRSFMERIDGITVKSWLERNERNFESPDCLWLAGEVGGVLFQCQRLLSCVQLGRVIAKVWFLVLHNTRATLKLCQMHCDAGMTHGDLTTSNFMVQMDGKVQGPLPSPLPVH